MTLSEVWVKYSCLPSGEKPIPFGTPRPSISAVSVPSVSMRYHRPVRSFGPMVPP